MRTMSSNPSAGVKKRLNVALCCCQSKVAGSASGVAEHLAGLVQW